MSQVERHKRYRKIGFLGEGQFATVFKAEDVHDNNKIVAVKKVRLEPCMSPTFVKIFLKISRQLWSLTRRSFNLLSLQIKLGCRSEAKDGINRTALREIKLLQELSHENICGLLNVFGHKGNISIVFPFMTTDLEVVIKETSIILSAADIKSFTLMTLKGLEYLHHNWILHRVLNCFVLIVLDF